MEVTVETPAPCLARISFSVPAEEFRRQRERGLKHMRGHVRMKGFRPGKAPLSVVEKAYGESILEETKQHFLREAFQKAVQDQELRPLGDPHVTHDDLAAAELDEEGGFAFAFEADLRPEVRLCEHEGLEVESQLAPVTDEEVEAALEDFRRRQSRPEPAGDAGLSERGVAIAKVVLEHEGESVLDREGLRVQVDRPIPGIEEGSWREALLGRREGDEVELQVAQLPADVEKEEARGQAGLCRLELTQVLDLVPPTDEELCDLMEAADSSELRARVREQLEEARRSQEQARIESELLGRVVAESELELPERMVADQVEARLAEARNALSAQGLPEESVQEELEKGREAVQSEAERSVRSFFVIEALAATHDLRLSDDDMRSELESIAARNDAKVEDVLEFYRKEGQLQQLGLEIVERKVRHYLRENARITEPA